MVRVVQSENVPLPGDEPVEGEVDDDRLGYVDDPPTSAQNRVECSDHVVQAGDDSDCDRTVDVVRRRTRKVDPGRVGTANTPPVHRICSSLSERETSRALTARSMVRWMTSGSEAVLQASPSHSPCTGTVTGAAWPVIAFSNSSSQGSKRPPATHKSGLKRDRVDQPVDGRLVAGADRVDE